MDDFSQLILLLTLKGVDEGDMINFLQTLGVSRENLATSSIIQIVNHGISFGDSVNDESMTGKKPISLAMFCLLKFIYSEKATKFCKIFSLLLTGTT